MALCSEERNSVTIVAEFRVTGLDALTAKLRALPQEIADKLGDNALKAGAKPIMAEMARTVRRSNRNEPHIADNIASQVDKEAESGSRVIHIGFRKNVSWRVHFLEFGTAHSAAHPFIRPAMDTQRDAALQAMATSLASGLQRLARDLSKG